MNSSRPEFVRFSELSPRYLNRDLQTHTVASDGQATVAQALERAAELGLGEIAFTDHVRKTSAYFSDHVNDIVEKRKSVKFRVYAGLETKALDEQGTLDVSPEDLARAEIVLGSVHRFPGDNGALIDARDLTYEEASKRELNLALGMLRAAPIDVLAHPGGMCQRKFGRFPQEYLEMLMAVSLERRIAIEINTSYWAHHLDQFIEICKKVNPYISVGSDAHRLEDVGRCREVLMSKGFACLSA
ncbi:MAG: histidinol-phosphatase [Elusimicrobia bacterium]|nr:histidinol-phosphatase [Elusimicrobiota bacterium]